MRAISLMSDAKRAQEAKSIRQAQVLRETFSSPAGMEALRIIVNEICNHDKSLPITQAPPGSFGDIALYLSGMRDVATELARRMNFTPSDTEVVVKTKRDG